MPPSSGDILDTLEVAPDDSIILAGGTAGFGQPGWVRAFDTADGSLLWQVDLSTEDGINQYVCSQQPTFTPDSQTAYATTCFLSDVGYSYVYAIRTGDEIEPVPGDLDGDGDVGLDDFAILSGCVTGPDGGPGGPVCEAAEPDRGPGAITQPIISVGSGKHRILARPACQTIQRVDFPLDISAKRRY